MSQIFIIIVSAVQSTLHSLISWHLVRTPYLSTHDVTNVATFFSIETKIFNRPSNGSSTSLGLNFLAYSIYSAEVPADPWSHTGSHIARAQYCYEHASGVWRPRRVSRMGRTVLRKAIHPSLRTRNSSACDLVPTSRHLEMKRDVTQAHNEWPKSLKINLWIDTKTFTQVRAPLGMSLSHFRLNITFCFCYSWWDESCSARRREWLHQRQPRASTVPVIGRCVATFGVTCVVVATYKVPEISREYILAQGPLEKTCGHFWQMVWEQEAKGVIMLNKTIEKGMVST